MGLYAPASNQDLDPVAWGNSTAALAAAIKAIAGGNGVLSGLTCNGSGSFLAGLALIGGYEVGLAASSPVTSIPAITDGVWDVYLQAAAYSFNSGSQTANVGTYPAANGVEAGTLRAVATGAGAPSGAPSVLLSTVTITAGAYVSANNAPTGRVSIPTLLALIGSGGSGGGGSTWREGTGAPSNTLGANGDFYLDGSTGNVYAKVSGSYALACNIKGDAGVAGATGAAGAAGATGATGVAGATGETGATGPAGPAGPAGADGAPGSDDFDKILVDGGGNVVTSGGNVVFSL